MAFHFIFTKMEVEDNEMSKVNEKFKNLDNILEDETACQLLFNFMKKNGCEENLLFLQDVKSFKSLTDENMIKDEAQRIAKKYIYNDSELQLNLSRPIVLRFQKNIEKDKISIDIFDTSMKSIKLNIQNYMIPQFLRTDEIIEYSNKKACVIF